MNYKEEKERLVDWIRRWFDNNGPDCNAVIGISGGKDSSIMAALCVEALGKDRVIGVLMPNGTQPDIDDSWRVIQHLGIDYYEINIEDAYNGLMYEIVKHIHSTPQAEINLAPRLRMATLYAIAQSVNGRVACTCNLSERMIGWETIWGDSVGDFAPFAQLTATEVIEIGKLTDLPYDLIVKTPSDGLCGKTDEDKFGFTYAELDDTIRNLTEGPHYKEIFDKAVKSDFKRRIVKMPMYPTLEVNQLGGIVGGHILKENVKKMKLNIVGE